MTTATAPRATLFGQYAVAESPSALLRMHLHQGGPLKPVDHEPKVGVLDQEDLIAQGIDTSQLIPGAQKVDALGSCTANAATSALSNVLNEATFLAATGAKSYADVVSGEQFAIRFYHQCTDQTGDPGQEWPPTDCGSSGQYIVSEAKRLKLASDERIAHGAENIVSLMQTDGLMVGGTWFNSWMEPDANGFVDGNGTVADLEKALRSGVAGGHETYYSAVEKLVLTATGKVDAVKTVLRARNSWTKSFGDNGSYRLHLSTVVALGSHYDFRQLVA